MLLLLHLKPGSTHQLTSSGLFWRTQCHLRWTLYRGIVHYLPFTFGNLQSKIVDGRGNGNENTLWNNLLLEPLGVGHLSWCYSFDDICCRILGHARID